MLEMAKYGINPNASDCKVLIRNKKNFGFSHSNSIRKLEEKDKFSNFILTSFRISRYERILRTYTYTVTGGIQASKNSFSRDFPGDPGNAPRALTLEFRFLYYCKIHSPGRVPVNRFDD